MVQLIVSWRRRHILFIDNKVGFSCQLVKGLFIYFCLETTIKRYNQNTLTDSPEANLSPSKHIATIISIKKERGEEERERERERERESNKHVLVQVPSSVVVVVGKQKPVETYNKRNLQQTLLPVHC